MKDVLEIRHLRIAQVLEQSACRLDGGLHGVIQTQRVKAADREVTEQPFFGRTRAEGGGRIALNKAVRFPAQRVGRVGDDLAGRGGGTLATGRHLKYEKNSRLSNLYRSMLSRMGTPVGEFADSTGELPGLDDPNFSGVA